MKSQHFNTMDQGLYAQGFNLIYKGMSKLLAI